MPQVVEDSARALRNLVLESELLHIHDALTERRIPCLVLKGIPLTRRLYERLEQRVMSDVDIMVPPHQVVEAIGVLEAQGFLGQGALETSRRGGHTYQLLRQTSTTVHVDLHWTSFPVTLPMPLEVQWSRTETLAISGRELLVYDPPLTILHLVAHLAKDGFLNGQTLTDFSRAWLRWAPELDLADFRTLAQRGHLQRATGHALALAQELDLLPPDTPSLGFGRSPLLETLMPPALVSARLTEKAPAGPSLIYRQSLSRYAVGDLIAGQQHLRRQLVPDRQVLEALMGKQTRWRLPVAYVRRALHPLLGRWDR